MRGLYGRYYAQRTAAVAAHVPSGSSVLELCCGPGELYLTHLRGRVAGYVGMDASPAFVGRLRAAGVDAREADVATADLPPADVVVMQASLYHFLPDATAVLRRMLAAARSAVVVCEPVRNLATSRLRWLAAVAARSTATASGEQALRFDAGSLEATVRASGAEVAVREEVAGGREHLYVLRPPAT